MQPFLYKLIDLELYTFLQKWSSISLNLPLFQTSGGIVSRPAAFPFLVDFSAFCSSSKLNGPFFMGNWYWNIFWIGRSIMTGDGPSSVWKWNFHFCNRAAWLMAFNLEFLDRFLPLISLIICEAFALCFGCQMRVKYHQFASFAAPQYRFLQVFPGNLISLEIGSWGGSVLC